MKRLALCIINISCCLAAFSSSFTGTWKGAITIGATQLPLVFHIDKTDNGYNATLDSPEQGAFGIAVTSVTVSNDNTIEMKMNLLNASYQGTLQDSIIDGTFTQGMALPLILHRASTTEAAHDTRPQTPKDPYPYKTEEVKFAHDGITLTGTLVKPSQGNKFPAVVFISGSGQQNRDEEILGHKPFLVIADHLARHGIASLRYDDRGIGGSTGFSTQNTTLDFANDAACALQFLRTQADIDSMRCGYIGHSEGGLISFINAAKSDDVSFVVTLAGPAVNGFELMVRQNIMMAQAAGSTPNAQQLASIQAIFYSIATSTDTQSLQEDLREIMTEDNPSPSAPEKAKIEQEIKTMCSPWYVQFIKYNPTNDLGAIKCPIFALGGDKDVQVDATQNLDAVTKFATQAKSVTTKHYPYLNHLFQTCKEPKDCLNYGGIEETIAPQVLDDITEWIKQL